MTISLTINSLLKVLTTSELLTGSFSLQWWWFNHRVLRTKSQSAKSKKRVQLEISTDQMLLHCLSSENIEQFVDNYQSFTSSKQFMKILNILSLTIRLLKSINNVRFINRFNFSPMMMIQSSLDHILRTKSQSDLVV